MVKIVKTGRRLRKFKLKNRPPLTKRQVKAIKKISQQSGELKTFYGNSFSDTSIINSSTNSVATSFGMLQGDGDDERIGDKVNIKDVSYNMIYTSTGSGVIRMVVIQQLENVSITNPLTGTDPNSFFEKYSELETKYKVLKDMSFTMSATDKTRKQVKLKFKSTDLKIKQFQWETGTSTQENIGQIRIYIYSDTSTPSILQVAGLSRLRYYDS